MMKKILLLSSAVFILTMAAGAQNAKKGVAPSKSIELAGTNPALKTASTPTLVTDVLHYYLNKFYFKTAITEYSNYPAYKSAASTVTNVTHCGSRFDVPAGETVTVTGLEAYARRIVPAISLVIPVNIYLCNLNAQGMPILPAIDSVSAGVGGSGVTLIGGNLINGPKTMTTSFAVVFRNRSVLAGDTALLLRTAGTTETNTASPANTKYSDFENGKDYGYVRFNGVFYSTRDFNLAPGFGPGTAYEFIVAPRVEYELQAGHQVPSFVSTASNTLATLDTACTREEMTFTNTSSGFYTHRQYNLNQFYRKWNLNSPFPQSVAGAFSSDSSITWSFEFYDKPGRDSRVFLPYANSGSIKAVTDTPSTPDCYTLNEFRARLKPMAAQGVGSQLNYTETFTLCLKYCYGDALGIGSQNGYDNLSVYPNPSINGKTLISGLTGENVITIYNMLGQAILNEETSVKTYEVDLTKYPKGTYVLRVVNSYNQARAIKLINEE